MIFVTLESSKAELVKVALKAESQDDVLQCVSALYKKNNAHNEIVRVLCATSDLTIAKYIWELIAQKVTYQQLCKIVMRADLPYIWKNALVKLLAINYSLVGIQIRSYQKNLRQIAKRLPVEEKKELLEEIQKVLVRIKDPAAQDLRYVAVEGGKELALEATTRMIELNIQTLWLHDVFLRSTKEKVRTLAGHALLHREDFSEKLKLNIRRILLQYETLESSM